MRIALRTADGLELLVLGIYINIEKNIKQEETNKLTKQKAKPLEDITDYLYMTRGLKPSNGQPSSHAVITNNYIHEGWGEGIVSF